MRTARRSVLLDSSANRVRRLVGPTAWSALEELLARAVGPGPVCEAVATTRALAADLGLSKDTVARALQTLRQSHLVEVAQDRTSAGTYGPGRYLITVPDGITLPDTATAAASTRLQPTSADSRITRRADSQLELTLD
jgi:DNA-binding transcriptional MocR family regulator